METGGPGVIIGDVVMENYHMVFDKSRNVFGYANQTTCTLTGSVSGTYTGPTAIPSISPDLALPSSLQDLEDLLDGYASLFASGVRLRSFLSWW